MNYLQKKFCYLVIVLLWCSICFGFLFSSSVYACSTCSKAPSDLELYFSTMDKLLGVLDTPPYQQGTWNQFGEDGKEMLFTTKATIQSAATTTLMSFVLVTHTAFLDLGWEIKTLAGTPARRRDRDALLQYDRKIMMKWLDIGKRAFMWKNVSQEQLKKIDEILQPLGFVTLNKNWWDYVQVLKQAKYDDILMMYRHMNYLYKRLHAKKWFHNTLEKVGTEYSVVDDLRKAETLKKPERESVQNFRNEVQVLVEKIFQEQQKEQRGKTAYLLDFKEDYKLFAAYIWQIQREYACAIGTKNQCDETRKKTVADSWENTKWRTADFQRSMKMFADAWTRLKWALWWWDDTAKKAAAQREEALMQSFYGWDVPQKRKRRSVVSVEWQNNGLEETIADTKALTKRLQDSFKNANKWTSSYDDLYAWSDMAQSLSSLPQDDAQDNAGKYIGKNDKKVALDEYIEQQVATRWLEQEIELQGVYAWEKRDIQAKAVQKTFQDIFMVQQEREKEAIFGDVRSATTLMPALSAAVWRNIELRWDKNEPSDKESSTIYNSAWKVCELQCSNLQGKCWYYTK